MTTSPGDTVLSSVQLDAIREELAAQLVWRERQLADLEGSVEEGTVSETAKAAILADIDSAGRNITQVRQALRDIADGTYGTCAGCRSPIPYERLKIRPLARCCVACQRSRERR